MAPEQVLFVGDSPEHDIVGAERAGMKTALIYDGDHPPPMQTGRASAKADHEVNNLSELLHLL